MRKIKPIMRMVSFLIVLSLLFFILSYLAKPSDNESVCNINGLYGVKSHSIDMVYIGGSASFMYYAPIKAWDDYGIVSYDYGSSGIRAESYLTMIKEVLKTQSPKVIVIDARAFEYRDKDNLDPQHTNEIPYRNVLTGMHLSRNKFEFINQYVEEYTNDNKLSYYFDLIKYHDNIANFNSDNIRMMLGKYKNPYNGFFINPDSYFNKLEQLDFSTYKKKSVSQSTENILTNLLDYLDTTNIECLFVVSPYVEKKEHKMIFNYIQDIINKHGYSFIDCNEFTVQMNLNYATDFLNDTHVNIFGAEKYTDFLNQYILDNYSIPNRKDDANYSFMNTYLSDWKNDVEKTKTEFCKNN